MTTDLTARARAGDADAFRELIEPHRRELQVHCYRILGSAQDAEDALQETLLAAWQGISGFEGRASIRTWLYQVATSRCLNALRAASRRPQMNSPLSGLDLPEPTRLGVGTSTPGGGQFTGGRLLAERSALRQQLVATRYSQVRTDERPSNWARPRQAASRVSCSASSASWADPRIR